MNRILFFVAVGLATTAAQANAGDWNAFRGPSGNGVSDEKKVLTSWGQDQNVVWKAKLPRPCNGSPIVSRGRVLLTCAEDDEGRQRSLYCFDRHDGKRLWVRTVQFDKVMDTHKTNPFCATTPVADGQCVVVWHASAGLYCYGLDGSERWSRDLGEFRHMWGYASSPVIHGDRVILNCGPGKRVFVTAIDLATGETLWETEEPQVGNGETNDKDHPVGSWSTPVLAKINGKVQIVCSMSTRVVAYDPDTGNILWTCDGLRGERGELAYCSPLISGDICVAIGGYNGPGIGIRLTGSGDITDSGRLWRNEKNPQSIGSGIFLGNHIYRANAGPGTIDCMEAETGRVIWRDRAAGGNHWASLVLAGGLLYATNQDGTTVVLKPNPERFEMVSMNELGESSNSTPAFSDGQIFFRTFEHLYCIGE